jgi:hypothetical protein
MSIVRFLERAVIAMTLPLLANCGSGDPGEGDALPTGVTLVIPDGLVAVELRLGGSACEGAEVLCGNPAGPGLVPASAQNLCAGENHYIHPVGEGSCRIEVELAGSPPFVRDVEIVRRDDGGLYAVGGATVLVE